MSDLSQIEAWLDNIERRQHNDIYGGATTRSGRSTSMPSFAAQEPAAPRRSPRRSPRGSPRRAAVPDDPMNDLSSDDESEDEKTTAPPQPKKAPAKKAASPKRKKKTSDDSKKRFELLGSKGTVYTQNNGQARGAAMKAANKGVKNIRLRELGTNKVHVFKGSKTTLPKSEWVTRTIGDSTIVNKTKSNVKKVGIETMDEKEKKTSAGKKKSSSKKCKRGQTEVRVRRQSKSTRRRCSRRTKSGGRRRVSKCKKGQKTYRTKSPKSHTRCRKKSKK